MSSYLITLFFFRYVKKGSIVCSFIKATFKVDPTYLAQQGFGCLSVRDSPAFWNKPLSIFLMRAYNLPPGCYLLGRKQVEAQKCQTKYKSTGKIQFPANTDACGGEWWSRGIHLKVLLHCFWKRILLIWPLTVVYSSSFMQIKNVYYWNVR